MVYIITQILFDRLNNTTILECPEDWSEETFELVFSQKVHPQNLIFHKDAVYVNHLKFDPGQFCVQR